MREDFRPPRFSDFDSGIEGPNGMKPRTILDSIDPESFHLGQILKKADNRWSRLAAGLAAFFTAGSVGWERLKQEDPNLKKDELGTDTYQVTKHPEHFKDFQENLESLKTMRDILQAESLMTYYQGTAEEEEFVRLVEEEEKKQQRANTGGSQSLEVLERAYANGLRNLDYLFQVADYLGVPKGILMGVALEESGFDKQAKNKNSTAKSEMQILDRTAELWGKKFAIQLGRWFQDFGKPNNPEEEQQLVQLKRLKDKLDKGEDLRTEDGLYLGAFGLKDLLRNRENEPLGVLAFKIGNMGVAQEVAKAKEQGGTGTFLEVRRQLENKDDQQYVIRVQAELNLFIRALDNLIDRVERQGGAAFRGQSDIFYDPKDDNA